MLEFKKCIGILYTEKENYIIEKKIGDGATSQCFKCFSFTNQNIFALKLFSENNINEYLTERQILSKLKNENIIKLKDYGEGMLRINERNENNQLKIYVKQNNSKINYEIFEYLEKGEIFEYIYYPHQGFSEEIAKTIFSQILNAIEHCHLNNIIHCDIKPENLLLNENFEIKLIDFGYSKFYNKNELIREWKGTKIYASPELYKNKLNGFDGEKIDIFSLGVLLYVLVVGKFPFECAYYFDKSYRHLINRDYDKFWEKRKINISSEFQDLINKMLCYEPDKRLSILEIRNHQWMKDIGKISDYIYQKEFEFRNIIVDIAKNKNTEIN